jgi:hypothetical protein
MYKSASPFNWKYNPNYKAIFQKPKLVIDWNKAPKRNSALWDTKDSPEFYNIETQNYKIKNFVEFSKQLNRKAIYKNDPNYKEYVKPNPKKNTTMYMLN